MIAKMAGSLGGKKKVFQIPDWWLKIARFDWLNPSYVVGGTVRDLVVKREAVDLDLLVPGLSEEKAFKLANKLRSPCFKLGKKDYVYRIVTSEGKIDLIPLAGRTLEEEARRRDFTINSLLLPLSAVKRKATLKKEIIDFLGGQDDLKKKVLRLCHPNSFKRDPVRLLRAVRFCLELGLRLDKDTACRLARDKVFLSKVPGERVKFELLKLFSLGFPEKVVGKIVSFTLWPEILSYGGLKPKPVNLRVQFEKALQTVNRIKKYFPEYFAKEVERGVEMEHLFYLFLAFFLSTIEQSKIPLALKRFRLSRKAVRACQAWLKCLQKDWFKDSKSLAELIVRSSTSFPAILILALIVNQKKLSQKSLLKFKEMYEIESGSFYPFLSHRVVEVTGLAPSFLLGEEIRQRKIAFLAHILDQ